MLWGMGFTLGAALAGCNPNRVGVGESCDTADDCEGSLVCALLAEDAAQRVCAAIDDTRPQDNCTPGLEGEPCDVVLTRSQSDSCQESTDCNAGWVCERGEASSADAASDAGPMNGTADSGVDILRGASGTCVKRPDAGH